MRKWYKLDNIGTFYSLTASSSIPRVFRFRATLKEEVNESILQEALDKTLKIYPNFNVNLKKGFYWYYLEETTKQNKVSLEKLPICFKLYQDSDDFLYRVSYYHNSINLEVSHILSDGKGTILFFKALITNYISLKNKLDHPYIATNSLLEKTEDSFTKYYEKPKGFKAKKIKAYRYKGKKLKNQTLFLECHLPLKKVLELSHKYHTTLTIFLISVLIYSFKDKIEVKEKNKPIMIEVPVDLRQYFSSSTSMNFFGLVKIWYTFNKDDKLEDIIKSVLKQFNDELTKENLSKRVNKMVSLEKNFFCRVVPLGIKIPVLSLLDKFISDKCTTSFSNVGKLEFDKEIEENISSISVLSRTNDFLFTICSFKDDLCIGISNRFINNDIIKDFCRYFSYQNISVKINASEVMT